MARFRPSLLGVLFSALFGAVISAAIVTPSPAFAFAPGDVNACTAVRNLSNSPGYTSVDPMMLASPDGIVHLFWAERIYGEPDAIPNVPDALVYSAWNGASWSQPIDLFLSPRELFNKRINGIRGVIDDEGFIHLVWQGPDNLFYYGSAYSPDASTASAWHGPILMANDQSGTQYSLDIANSGSQTLHVVYGQENLTGPSSRSVRYVRSDDRGATWSQPTEIYTFPQLDRGPSNVRIVPDGERLYVTWTEWDSTGNGQAIYFARSLDGGATWDTPVVLDRRLGNEYERDWVTLAVLGENELVVFWEGGWRAYRQAQYSNDGGKTWTDPIDTLDWLIADNGFAEFVRDSTGRLHLFVFQRVREGNDDKGSREGLWHTTLDGPQKWREPQLVGNPNNGNFVTVAINRGNQLFAAWFDYTSLEIRVIQCEIAGAPSTPAVNWPIAPSLNGTTLDPQANEEASTTVTPPPANEGSSESPSFEASSPTGGDSLPGLALIGGIVPTLLILIAAVLFTRIRRQARPGSH